jgi:hypothetical protein
MLAAAFLVFATGAFSSSAQPADKVVAAGDNVNVVSSGQDVTLLTATMNSSKPTDLVLNVSLECSIITTVMNTGTSTSSAFGQVRVWTEVDGKVVPIRDMSSPPQTTDAGGNKTDDSAVFCERTHTVDFMPTTQTDTINQYQNTKSANAFNWLRLNVGSGLHTITVKADLNTAMTNATAQAMVGNRTLVVTPTKMANNAVISNPGSG